MLYMVIETYLHGPDPVYERFGEQGRMLPDGLEYVSSWLEAGPQSRCFQLMTTDDVSLFDVWIEHWADLVSFEIVEVAPSPTSTSTS